MAMIRLAGFSGTWPILDSRYLPDNAATVAINLQVDASGILRGMLGSTAITSLSNTTRYVYRIPLAGENTLINSYWWQHTDENTDVVRSPVTNDQYERYYWASPSGGLKFATKAQILAGAGAHYILGFDIPATAPRATPVVGTGDLDPDTGENTAPQTTRSYVVTFINEFGEESAPSPGGEATGATDQDWLIDQIPQPPAPGGKPNYSKVRLYRSVTTTTGSTDYYKVVDLNLGILSYTDILDDTVVGGQTFLETAGWTNPPTDMQGIAAMANGIIAGFKGNTLYFSENYRPHAWPDNYRITTEYPIVGMAAVGDSLVVATTGRPAVVSGTKSAMMSFSQNMAPLPCLCRRSIVAAPDGIYWASENGLVRVGLDGQDVITGDLISRDIWRNQYLPDRQHAVFHNGIYTAFRNIVGTGDDVFMFAPLAQSKTGVVFGDLGVNIWNIGIEPWTNKCWIITGSSGSMLLSEWKDVAAARLSYTWTSKRFPIPKPINFAVMSVYLDNAAGAPVTIKASCLLRGKTTDVWKEVWTRTVTRSGREYKCPDGFKSDLWQFEFTGQAPVQEFQIAQFVQELKSG